MSIKCLMNGLEVNYPCSPVCPLFGDCVSVFEAQKKEKVVTNFDHILSMNYEKFAEFIMLSPEMEFGVCECCEVFRGHGAYTPCGTEDGWCTAELRCNAFKKWLQQPVEEVRDGDG